MNLSKTTACNSNFFVLPAGGNGRKKDSTKEQKQVKKRQLQEKASESAKVQREKRNASIDIMRKVIPGVGAKANQVWY